MNIKEKLSKVQQELKCNKGQYNKFGNYNYRSLEDIQESVKPLLGAYNLALVLADDIVSIGDRYYIKATATLYDCESEETIVTTALARESLDRKGMDDSQITGTASSYARKYCLNGLFAIDDTKDADTNEYQSQSKTSPKTTKTKALTKDELIDKVVALCDTKRLRVSDVCKTASVTTLEELDEKRLQGCIEWLQKK
jgi:phage antirepressor YoqD-like protein